ncbi:hypothetical protein X777_14045, partial [Ooceraea biroi]
SLATCPGVKKAEEETEEEPEDQEIVGKRAIRFHYPSLGSSQSRGCKGKRGQSHGEHPAIRTPKCETWALNPTRYRIWVRALNVRAAILASRGAERLRLFATSKPVTRFDLAGNQEAGRCTTRRTVHSTYPINEIALATAALAPRECNKGRRKRKGNQEDGSELDECGLSHVSRHISNFTVRPPQLLLLLRLLLAKTIHLSLSLSLPVYRVPDFPSLLPFAKVLVG